MYVLRRQLNPSVSVFVDSRVRSKLCVSESLQAGFGYRVTRQCEIHGARTPVGEHAPPGWNSNTLGSGDGTESAVTEVGASGISTRRGHSGVERLAVGGGVGVRVPASGIDFIEPEFNGAAHGRLCGKGVEKGQRRVTSEREVDETTSGGGTAGRRREVWCARGRG